ncbi:MAG: sn-glycerol-3-phosphate ABC transporter ATP-binding protein UgpC [Proteobacteria bacterium]|nr:sn-glycerol-3-phosphate ABC transporter ATP-binding protein UgpC [Pseudomonadota bacterium]
MATVEFRKLAKNYGAVPIVHGIDLQVADGEFVVLVGPSGCGKSTCLRMLAGLEDISGGEILIDGRVVNEVDARDRDIAMVFQDYALYPHMSVFENIAFSLRYRGVPAAEIGERVREAARVLDLGALLDRKPKQLSGGQRQRVAMGRAIVRKPKVFLFDEPLSNLDAKLRGQMRLEIKRLHRSFGITTIYVTHDQVEAMTLADRVVVMRGGHIEQVGSPDDVYHRPRTQFVAGFIGAPTMNLLNGTCRGGQLVLGDGPVSVPLAPGQAGDHAAVVLGIRPEDVTVAQGETPAGMADVSGTVDVVEALGPDTLVFASISGQSMVARVRPEVRPLPGSAIGLRLDLQRSHLFAAPSGVALRS